jgi:RNA polymerase sigma factor (sigma-70 family)
MSSVERLTAEQRRLVQENAPLAKFLARKRWEMAPGALDYEELVSLAYQGLVTAASRWRAYSEENGVSESEIASGEGFSIFSRKRIIGSILDWQRRDADHVPRSYRTDFKLLQRVGYPEKIKNYETLSELTSLPIERIRLIVSAVERSPISFHEMVNDEGEVMTSEPIASQNVEGSVLLSVVGSAVAERVESLPELQQVVLALRYFEGLELQAIASELNISLSIVREAHNAAILSVSEAMLLVVTV